MFLLVPAYPGCPGQTAVKWLLLLLFSDESWLMAVHCQLNSKVPSFSSISPFEKVVLTIVGCRLPG